MLQEQMQRLKSLNTTWNVTSGFKVVFLNTGSFFEITNSSGKVHDLSFQSILQSLKDILGSNQTKIFITYSVQIPSPIRNNQDEDQVTFDNIEVTDPIQCSEWKYYEKMVRVIGGRILSYPRAQVAALEQSKLFFNVISRIVHIANNISPQDLDNRIPFNDSQINCAIEFLEQAILSFTPSVESFETAFEDDRIIDRCINTIYIGAPGTGKSWAIDQETGDSIKIRTVFHSDTQYSDFVGSLRPKMEGDETSRTVSYEFRPGPFTSAFIEAKNNQHQRVFLIIEELNRAPAASVFGDLFQLLDPDISYEINIDPDMLDYINSRIPVNIEKLSLPMNLTILATMNSSDQGVNTLDTAFKRRWSIKYIPINYINATPGVLPISVEGRELNIEWREFAKIINNKLMEIGVPEDRLLGHRFLSINEIANRESARDALSFKLLVYLWDDVLRHGRRQSIFASEAAGMPLVTFGQLVTAYTNGNSIFNAEIEGLILNAVTPVHEDI